MLGISGNDKVLNLNFLEAFLWIDFCGTGLCLNVINSRVFEPNGLELTKNRPLVSYDLEISEASKTLINPFT